MRPRLLLLLALGLVGPSAPAEVVVRAASDLVDIDASAVPLADILDDLARQTGMEIVYEGAPPRQRVTLTLQGRSPAEAVQDVLEGQGLNYALIADPTGARVQTLIITGPAGTGTSAGSSAAAASPRPRPPFVRPPAAGPEMLDDPGFDEMEAEDPFEDPALLEDPLPEDDPAFEEPDPAVDAPEAPDPATGPVPFPGGQPQQYPVSPFAPKPVFPGAPAGSEPDGEGGTAPPPP